MTVLTMAASRASVYPKGAPTEVDSHPLLRARPGREDHHRLVRRRRLELRGEVEQDGLGDGRPRGLALVRPHPGAHEIQGNLQVDDDGRSAVTTRDRAIIV